MKAKRNRAVLLLGILGIVLACGGRELHTYAAQGGAPSEEGSRAEGSSAGSSSAEASDEGDAVLFTYGEDGLVEKRKEFVIPAAAGENFDIEITFTGSGADSVLSFFYDRVTEDQMVPNIDKSADDRSGLLGEAVKAGEEQTRSFCAAAIDGDIVITAVGNGRVLSIKAVKRAARVPGEKVCVYTIGDSLVQTYAEKYAPQTGWGQTLPLYFDDQVSFVNRALGGRSTGNYLRQGRLNEVLCEIAPGDCVLIEFGHNDSTSGNRDRYVSVDNFKKNLTDVYIKAIRDRDAIPILVTLCNRNQYNRTTGEFSVSFPKYVEAMREAAAETDTLLIDLNAITVAYFTELNQELGTGVTNDIIYNHAIAGAYEGEYAKGVRDDTHLQYYGAKLVGGFVAEELSKLKLQGVSEHYTPLETAGVPTAPAGITEKVYEGFTGRITWTPCEGADYYKVLAAEVVEKAGTDGAAADVAADGTASGTYELAGEFELAGYTAVCDFANSGAEAEKHYAYKVVAVNAAGESQESEIFSFGLLKENANEPETDIPGALEPEAEQPPAEQGMALASQTVFVVAAVLAAGIVLAVIGVLIKKKVGSHRQE